MRSEATLKIINGSPASEGGNASHVHLSMPASKRIVLWLQAMIFTLGVKAMKTFKPLLDIVFPKPYLPTLTKKYPSRPGLKLRVFFPRDYDHTKPTKTKTPLPCFFSIHGGGFVVGMPDMNDRWNHQFCNTHSALVVALDYRKAPKHSFPTPIHDLAALITAVLDDRKGLARHIDPDRVAIGGFSAGGNLTLAVSQLPQIRDRVQAIVPVYPACDFATSTETKAQLRRYKPELGGFRAAKDYLLLMLDCFNWSYIPVGQNLKDPLLSSEFVPPSALPNRVFVIACEMDLLAHGAWRMACKLAGKPVPGYDQPVGRQQPAPPYRLVLDDELYHWDHKTEDGRDIKWLLVPDVVHAFDMEAEIMAPWDKLMQEDAAAKKNEEIQLIGKWLWGDGTLN